MSQGNGGRGGKPGGGRARSGLDGSGGRLLEVNLKTGHKRKPSSNRWLKRQLNDPYVYEAQKRGYKSRAAFKLLELDERFRLLRPGLRVVDLGAAPGGWTQVAVDKVRAGKPGGGLVVGIDILDWGPIPDAHCITLDFLDPAAPDLLKEKLGGPADLVLSDMAAPTTGHPQTDHLRIIALLEVAWAFAEEVLAPGGAFVCKVFQGGATGELLTRIKQSCATVKHAKPPASRKESAELYLVAQGFRKAP